MTRPISALCVLVALAFALAACGGGSNDSSTEIASSKPSGSAGASDAEKTAAGDGRPARVFRADTETLDAVVFDEFGYALYRFDKDKGGKSACYGACAKQWPPLLTEGQPVAFAVIPSELGMTDRRDGTTQVTYFGHPLYTFVGDKKYPTGQIHGHHVEAFGGTWYALHKNGEDVKR